MRYLTHRIGILSVLENLIDIDDPLHSQNKNINVKVTTEVRRSA